MHTYKKTTTTKKLEGNYKLQRKYKICLNLVKYMYRLC